MLDQVKDEEIELVSSKRKRKPSSASGTKKEAGPKKPAQKKKPEKDLQQKKTPQQSRAKKQNKAPKQISVPRYDREPRPVSTPQAPRTRKRRTLNKELAGVTYFSVAIFLALIGYLIYFIVARSNDFANSAYNKRQDSYAEHVIRGSITDRNGNVLAMSTADDAGNETRTYPYGSLFAHAVGYTGNGKTSLEAEMNYYLLNSHAFFLEKISNDFADKKNPGDTVVTTLDVNVQQAAAYAMGSSKGAVIAMEPGTGKIVCMYSNPGFDPNTVKNDWEYLNSDTENTPLVNRVTNGLYPPGSTFKTVTALDFMRYDPAGFSSFSFDCSGGVTYGDTTIQCYNGTVHGHLDMASAFAQSCNSAFVTIGKSLKTSHFRDTAEDLLFNKRLPCPIDSAKSSFRLDGNTPEIEKMMTAMGQGQTLVSPYHMCLITSAIANGGTLMRPYMVSAVTNYGGDVVETFKPRLYRRLITAEEAALLGDLMEGVVTRGTAFELSSLGYTVAGKTGTAEYSSDKSKSHSWFTGYSNVDNPDLVVTVIMEGYDGNSEARAIPVAKSVFQAYHNQ